ncbi:MAG: hypothetical protein EOP04_00740 [Proteobacteria bacterium]|nr:MAG: hypothetical protein EOP04_00740 [Pseudomonadota bacterium]
MKITFRKNLFSIETTIQSAEISHRTHNVLYEYLLSSPPIYDDSFLFSSSKGKGLFRDSVNQFLSRNHRTMLLHHAEAIGLSNVYPQMPRVFGLNDLRQQCGGRSDAKKKMGHGSEEMVMHFEHKIDD